MEGSTKRRLPNEIFKYEREEKHWSQDDVADRLNAPNVKTIRRWELGETRPDIYYAGLLVQIFGKKEIRELGWAKEGEVPFMSIPRQNRLFTGREGLLRQLDDLLPPIASSPKAGGSVPCALIGLGGIGKSQIALEYSYRYMDKYQIIVRLDARSQQTLNAAFDSIASLVGLPERDVPDQEKIIAAVKQWLSQLTIWLLIFDSADDEEVMQRIADLMPEPCRGHVIITTRLGSVGQEVERIGVGPMSVEEGATLLLRRAKVATRTNPDAGISENVRHQAELLAQQLGGLPLALDQAGAYVEDKGVTLARYARLYQDRLQQVKLRRRRGNYAAGYPDSVATTWSLSFDRIKKANPAAIELVRLLSFLHPQSIPEEVITEGAPLLGPLLSPAASDPDALNEAFGELLRHSLVSRDGTTETCNIHSLVQAVVRDGMDEKTQRQWAEHAVRAVNRAFPEAEFLTVSYINRQRCERCLPHALACAALITDYALAFPEAARLLGKAAHYLRDRGQFVQAEGLARRALEIDEKVLGVEHIDVTISLDILGEVCYELGEYAESLELFSRALSIRRHILEPDHPDIANTMNNLAALYHIQGQYDQAEALYLAALSLRKKILGSSHPDIATSMNTLAGLYNDQGRYDEAEILYQQARAMDEKTLGPDHPNVAISCNNLSGLYRRQGKYEQAEPLLMRALEIWMQALGPNHPDVGTALNNLGKLNYLQGKYDQVELLYKQALEIYEQALGPMHPYVAGTLNNLANLYLDQEKYEQAEILYQRSLAIREKILGPEHPEVAQSLFDLGRLYTIQGRYLEAESLLTRALAIREKVLGPGHPDTTATRKANSDLLERMEQTEETAIRMGE